MKAQTWYNYILSWTWLIFLLVFLHHLHNTKRTGDKAKTQEGLQKWDMHLQRLAGYFTVACLEMWVLPPPCSRSRGRCPQSVFSSVESLLGGRASEEQLQQNVWQQEKAHGNTWGDVGTDMENRKHPWRGRKEVPDKRRWLPKEVIFSELF